MRESKRVALTSVERISDSPPEGSFSPRSQSNTKQLSQDRASDGKENLDLHNHCEPREDRAGVKRRRSAPAISDPLQKRKRKGWRKEVFVCQTQPAEGKGSPASATLCFESTCTCLACNCHLIYI